MANILFLIFFCFLILYIVTTTITRNNRPIVDTEITKLKKDLIKFWADFSQADSIQEKDAALFEIRERSRYLIQQREDESADDILMTAQKCIESIILFEKECDLENKNDFLLLTDLYDLLVNCFFCNKVDTDLDIDCLVNKLDNKNDAIKEYIIICMGFSGKHKYIPILRKYENYNNDEIKETAKSAIVDIEHPFIIRTKIKGEN